MGKKKAPGSRVLIRDYIQVTFGIIYTLSALSRVLHRLGLKRLRPNLIPGKPPILEVQIQFIQRYKQLKLFEKIDPGIIQLFSDGMHLIHQVVPSFYWGAKGSPIVLPSNSSRQRLNILGAYSPARQELVHLTSENNCDAIQVIKFLECVVKQYSHCHSIILHLDNARYFHARQVRCWLKEHPELIINRLPAYAPNLNLIERLWRFIKEQLVHNRYYEEYKTFRAHTFRLLNKVHDFATALRSLISDNFELVGNF